MRILKKIIKFLDNYFEEIVVVALLAAMSIIIGIQVFMRYVMKASLSWSEELARYMFIWLVYVGISYGVKKNKHIKVDAVLTVLPKIIKNFALVISDIIFLMFSVIIIIKGIETSSKILSLGQHSPAMGIPMGFIYLAAPIGFFLVGIRLLQSIIYRINNIRKGVA